MHDFSACAFGMRTERSIAQAAFTLVELLVVSATVGLLALVMATALSNAIEAGRDMRCRSQLRQMAFGALLRAELDGGLLPASYERDVLTGATRTWEWVLWHLGTEYQVQQCPSFRGAAMWDGDKFTGYNYNSSYLGGRILRRGGVLLAASLTSARIGDIRNPSECAMFGDGEYENGANKFMRSPFPGPLDPDASLALGGTQGFRHRGRTNVAFADGHVESRSNRYTTTAAPGSPAPQCGFLSPDNRLYDLE